MVSKIARKPIIFNSSITAKLTADNIEIKGPKGVLDLKLPPPIKLKMDESGEEKSIVVDFDPDSKRATALAGTINVLVRNMIIGVSEGFTIELELVGVGYRAQSKGDKLELFLGFSHPIEYTLKKGVSVQTPKPTHIILQSIDKQKVGQVAAEIRAFRPPEPYKGKGVRYLGEKISLKEIKKK